MEKISQKKKWTELEILKNNLVTDMFVNVADQDYIISRLAYQKGLMYPFFWNAGQAIEKYLKASLLLNGKSSKSQGHDLQKLYREICLFAGDLLPTVLVRPSQLTRLVKGNWTEETPVQFLERTSHYASTANRYGVFGYTSKIEDICHLDQLIFAIRRLAFGLHLWPFLGKHQDGAPQTVRAMLEQFPEYSPRGRLSEFHKLTSEMADPDLRHAAFNMNFPFAPANYNQESVRILIRSGLKKSVLFTNIIAPAENGQSPSNKTVAADLADWAVTNIKFPSFFENQLKSASEKLRDNDRKDWP